jgi:hypothetical protein
MQNAMSLTNQVAISATKTARARRVQARSGMEIGCVGGGGGMMSAWTCLRRG